MAFRLPTWIVGVPLLVAVAGCGDGRVEVLGEVTIAGKPVDSGTICFEPADGKGATCGGGIEAGRYHLVSSTGVFPGKKLVRITAVQNTGKKIPAGPPMPPDVMVDEVRTFNPPVKEVEIAAGKVNQLSLDF